MIRVMVKHKKTDIISRFFVNSLKEIDLKFYMILGIE